MILDAQQILSDGQALLATANSTSVIDFGALGLGDKGIGGSVMELIVSIGVVLDSAGDAATLVITVDTDNDEAFGSATNIFTSGTIAEATLVAGYKAIHMRLPILMERYLRITYTVAVEDFTSGNVDAFVLLEGDNNIIA